MSRLGKLAAVRWPVVIASGIAILFVLGLFEPLELITVDGRFQLQGKKSPSPHIAIIGITQQCIERVGKLPWPRSAYAEIIDYLAESKAKVICFDIFFPVPSEQEEDLKLVEATQRAGNVIYPVFSPIGLEHYKKGSLYRVDSLRENIQPLSKAAAGVGHINVPPDTDSRVRRVPVALESEGKLIYQLGLETVIHYRGIDKARITLEKNSLRLGKKNVPLTREGDLLINYRGQEKELDFYPFHKVLEGQIPGESFKDRIILIGQVAHGLPNADLISTPLGEKYGAIVQSVIIDNLLRGDFLVRQGLVSSLVTIIFLSLLTGMLFTRLSLVKSVMSLLISLTLVVVGAIYLFNRIGFILEIVPCLTAVVANFGLSLTLNLKKFRQEVQQKDFELSGLFRTSRISAEDLLMDRIPQVMVNTIGETIGVEALSLYLRDDTTDSLSLRAEYSHNKSAEKEISRIAEIANRLVEDSGEVFLTGDLSREPRFKKLGLRASSFLSSPLVVRNQIKGVLNFYNKGPSGVSRSRYFTKEDLRLISAFSHQTAVILENSHLLQAIDIKNRRLIEAMRELKAAQEELVKREKLSAVGRMASMIIHDIKNPIATVRLYAELLGQADGQDVDRHKYCQIILSQIDRVTEMAQEVLDYTKGKSSLRPRVVEVESLVEELVTLLREDFKKHGIKLVTDMSFKGSMKIDKEKMVRVFLNLARNAAEATAGEGTVTISGRKENSHIEFRVFDDGPGIAEEIENRLFEPFVTHGKKYGTGLGLAIAKKIVEDHGGRISVESESGAGTSFIIKLPCEMGQERRNE